MSLASEEKVPVVDHHDNVSSPSADTDWAAAKRMKVLGTTSSDARVPAHKRMVDRIGSIDKSLVRAQPCPIIVTLPDGNGFTFNSEAINDPLLMSSASTRMTITPTVIDHWEQTKRMESKYSEKKVSETALFGARLPVDEDHHDNPRNFRSFNKNSVTHSLFGLPPRDNIGEVMKQAYFKPDWAEAKHMKLENTEKKVLGSTSCDARVPAQLYHKRMVDCIGSFDKNGPSVDTGLVGAQSCPNIVMLPDDNGNMFNSENINNPCLMASASTCMPLTSIIEAHWEKAKRMESKYPPRPLSPDKLAHDAACS